MKSFFDKIRKFEIFLTIMAMIAFTIIAFLQVTFRVFLHHPLGWSEELCKFLFIWCTFLGSILVSSDDGHFKVDFIIIKLPKLVQKILKYLSYLLMIIFCIILIKYGSQLMRKGSLRSSPALGIRMSFVYIIIPFNGILVILHLIEHIIEDIIIYKGGQ